MEHEMKLDAALESLFQAAFEMTSEQEQGLYHRILAERQKQAQEWAAFANVMLGLQAQFRLPSQRHRFWQPFR